MVDGSIMRCAAIVCGEVAAKDPILYASRSAPAHEADSGWQFLCGRIHEDAGSAQVWAVHQVLEYDQSLEPFLGFPEGTVLERNSLLDEWQVTLGSEADRR